MDESFPAHWINAWSEEKNLLHNLNLSGELRHPADRMESAPEGKFIAPLLPSENEVLASHRTTKPPKVLRKHAASLPRFLIDGTGGVKLLQLQNENVSAGKSVQLARSLLTSLSTLTR